MFEFCCLWNIAVRSITFSYRIRGWYTWVHIEGYPRLFVHRTGILVLYLFPVSCANMRNLKETKKESHGKTDGYLGHRSIPDIKTLHSPSLASPPLQSISSISMLKSILIHHTATRLSIVPCSSII